MFKHTKVCFMCYTPINDKVAYTKIKHNNLIEDKNEYDTWQCITKEYICPDCIEKMREYILLNK